MFSRSAMVLGAVAAVEMLVFALAVGRFGVLLLLLVVAALSAFGFVYLFRQMPGMVQQTVEGVMSPDPGAKEELGDRGLRFAGGALLAFPGLLTGLFGGFLLLQPVRSAARSIIGARLARFMPADSATPFSDLDRMFRRRDVVDVDAIKRNPDGSSSKSSAPSELR